MPPDLPALLALASRADQGPWRVSNETDLDDGWWLWSQGKSIASIRPGEEPTGHEEANGKYLAALSPAVLVPLLRELMAAREVVKAARVAQKTLSEHWFGDYPDDPGGRNNDGIIEADNGLKAALANLDAITAESAGGEKP